MSASNHAVILLIYFFLVNYVVVEGSGRSFKFDSSTHSSSKSTLPDGNTIDDIESVKTGIAVKVASSVTSRLISSPPAEFSDGDSSSDGSTVPVIVICTVLLAVLVTGLVWFICRKRGNDEDGVQYAPSVASHVTPALPAPVASVNNGGAATVINRHPVAVPMTDPRLKASQDKAAAAAKVSVPGTSNPRPSRDAEFGLISSNELTRRDNAAAAARANAPGTSNPRPSRDAEFGLISSNELTRRHNAAVAARANAPGTSKRRPSRDTEFGPISFNHKDLQRATSNFSAANILGEGGFAKVYKGCLPDSTILAVKMLKSETTTGDREFRNEVKTISLAKHKNIVRLIGYCITDSSRCIVYEYVENKTLHDHLRGGEGIKTMEWPIRMKIARDAAKGIVYLHEDCPQRIIHRDIKPANILLSLDFVAKVADFGIAKLCPEHFKSHIASYIKGSYGFIDPTYSDTGVLTFKSDVYSFGVVLVQLVSAVTELTAFYQLRTEQLPRALESGNFRDIADPKLNNKYVHEEMALILTCANACLRKDPKDRPSIIQVSRVLERLISVNELKRRNIRRQSV